MDTLYYLICNEKNNNNEFKIKSNLNFKNYKYKKNIKHFKYLINKKANLYYNLLFCCCLTRYNLNCLILYNMRINR